MTNHLFDQLLEAGARRAAAIETALRTFTYGDLDTESARWAAA